MFYNYCLTKLPQWTAYIMTYFPSTAMIPPFICNVDMKILVMSFSEVQTLPPWLPYLEYAIITVTGMVILMTIGCACFKLVQVLGSRSKNEREEKKHRSFRQERKQSKRSQVLPKSMDF